MKAYELTEAQLDHSGSELATLAVEAGYASARSMLNEHNRWGDEVEAIVADLREELANRSTPDGDYQITEDLTAFFEYAAGKPCQLVVRSENMDDYDTYVPTGKEWVLQHDSLSNRSDELAEADKQAFDSIWENSAFVEWSMDGKLKPVKD